MEFNPTGVLHFGGVRQRMVRSCKKAMMATVGSRTLTDDVQSTTISLVEQILNLRFPESVNVDSQGLEASNQSYILLGRSSPASPFVPDAQRFVALR